MKLKFNYAEVEQYCNELPNISSRLSEVLEKAKSEVSKIQSSEYWTGPASDSFVQKFNEFSNSFDEITDVLDRVVLYVAQCSDNYESIDNSVINQIKSNMNVN